MKKKGENEKGCKVLEGINKGYTMYSICAIMAKVYCIYLRRTRSGLRVLRGSFSAR